LIAQDAVMKADERSEESALTFIVPHRPWKPARDHPRSIWMSGNPNAKQLEAANWNRNCVEENLKKLTPPRFHVPANIIFCWRSLVGESNPCFSLEGASPPGPIFPYKNRSTLLVFLLVFDGSTLGKDAEFLLEIPIHVAAAGPTSVFNGLLI
jgi:hypothetical protein